MSVSRKLFGRLADGTEVHLFTIKNSSGAFVRITNFGGAVVSINVPDRNGELVDVVCGYDKLESYVKGDGYLGALIGRYGNRIDLGRFRLDGREYKLYCNDGDNHLHGGKCGFSHRVWAAEAQGNSLTLRLESPDGDEGYPGNLKVKVTYVFTDDNALEIRYHAETDKRTILNLTNHSYFNLGGYASGSVRDHELWLDAEAYLPTDQTLIPTGEIRSVEGTPFDFRIPKTIGCDIDLKNADLITANGGFDHCLCFAGGGADLPVLRAELYSPKTGCSMQVYTDRPCVQLYTANFFTNPDFPLKGGVPQGKHNAVCLETQVMPDSINHSEFTECTLSPGQPFNSTTVFLFKARD